MSRRGTIALVLLSTAAVLAGCLTATADDPAGDASPAAADQDNSETSTQKNSGTSFSWELRDCRIAAAMISVDAEALRPHLPAGFEPVPPGEGFFGVPDPTGQAVLGVDASSCQQGSGPSGTQTDAVFGGVLALVEPPEHHEQDGNNTLYLVRWDTAVPDPTIRENLTKLGVPAYDGEMEWADYQNPAGDVVIGGSDLILDDGLVFHPGGAGPIPGAEETRDFTCISFHETDEGELVTTRMEFKASVQGNGPGVLKIPSGHWASDLVHEAPWTSGAYLAGQLDYEHGSVTLPS